MESWIVNPLDVLVVIVLLLSGFYALMRGFVREVLGIVTWVCAFFAALWGYAALAPSFQGILPTLPWAANAMAWAAIFLGVLVVLYLIAALISKLVRNTVLSPLDRSLGFMFGLVRGWLIMVALTLALNWLVAPEKQPAWLSTAVTRPLLDASAGAVVPLLPQKLRSAMAPAYPTQTSAERAREVQRQFERLVNPQPVAVPAGEGTAVPAREGNGGSSGYRDRVRSDLDRLVEGTP